MSLHLFYTWEQPEAPKDELFPYKRNLAGAYLFSTDDVPHKLSVLNWNSDKAELDLNSSGGQGTEKTLEFHLRYKAEELSGILVSAFTGEVGDVKLALVPGAQIPTSDSTLEGLWKGKWIEDSNNSNSVDMTLQRGFGASKNPDDIEVDLSPAYIGSITIRDVRLPLSSFAIDHLREQVRMRFTGEGGGDLMLAGDLRGNRLDVSATSTFKGAIGTMSLTRSKTR